VRHWLYLATKFLGDSPNKCCLILLLQWAVAPFLGDVKPLGLDICGGVDSLDTCSPGTGSPQAPILGARACPEPGFEVGL
jgi:hypothetical protein